MATVTGRRGAVESFAELAGRILAGPARLGGVRLVAVDGGTGLGEEHLRRQLARAVVGDRGTPWPVVQTDDLLDGWDDQFTFWTRLEETVLAPLRHGEPADTPVYDWYARAFTTVRHVPVPDVLIVEGVSAARRAGEGARTLSIFLDADPGPRLRRALERDGGAQIEAELRTWLRRRAAVVRGRSDGEHAGPVVDGAARVGHHPEGDRTSFGEVDHG